MIASDSEIAVKKFKMFAEKADSEAKIVELCKKYLKHKGIDVDHEAAARDFLASQIAPPKIETVYANPSDVVVMQQKMAINRYNPNLPMHEQVSLAQQSIVKEISYRLVKEDHIKFENYTDIALDQVNVYGILKVWKGR